MHGEARHDAEEVSAILEELPGMSDERRIDEARKHGELRLHATEHLGE